MLMRILTLMLLIGAVVASGCAEKTETPVQIIETISAIEGFTLIQENENNSDFIIIDVRTPEEFAGGHLDDAINLNFNSDAFRDELNKLDKDKTYLIYCRSGNRSAKAHAVMEELGFREVYDMGGIIDWTAEGFPVVK